jgi:hypothetical protein
VRLSLSLASVPSDRHGFFSVANRSSGVTSPIPTHFCSSFAGSLFASRFQFQFGKFFWPAKKTRAAGRTRPEKVRAKSSNKKSILSALFATKTGLPSFLSRFLPCSRSQVFNPVGAGCDSANPTSMTKRGFPTLNPGMVVALLE